MVRLDAIRERLRRFNEERDSAQFHNPKNLAMAIISEVGELAAVLRWVDGADADAFVRKSPGCELVEQEVADVAISLLLFCDRSGIDLLDAIERKLEVNRIKYPVEEARGRAERPSEP